MATKRKKTGKGKKRVKAKKSASVTQLAMSALGAWAWRFVSKVVLVAGVVMAICLFLVCVALTL